MLLDSAIATLLLGVRLALTELVDGEKLDSTFDRKHLGDLWTFHCPHTNLGSRAAYNVTVGWSLNGVELLTIADGTIVPDEPEVSSFHTRQLGANQHVVRAGVQRNRLTYYYDTAVGDYSLTISHTIDDDVGLWSCDVLIRQVDNPEHVQTLSSQKHLDLITDDGRTLSKRRPKSTAGQVAPIIGSKSTTVIQSQSTIALLGLAVWLCILS